MPAAHQKQDDYDYQYDTDDSTGTVSPAASVRPGGQHADEHQDQDNQQNGAKAHDLLPLFTATASRARTRVRQSGYPSGRVSDKSIGNPERRLFVGAHGTVCGTS